MTKAEEMLLEIAGDMCIITPEEAIEFAQKYALACLEKAAENAKIDESWTDIHGYTILQIDKDSITSKDNLIWNGRN